MSTLSVTYGRSLSVLRLLICQIINFILWAILGLIAILIFPRLHGLPPFPLKILFGKTKSKKHTQLSLGLMDDTNLDKSIPLKIDHLTKIYNGKVRTIGLEDLSLTMPPKEVFVVIGPNGSGKSTMINSITGEFTVDNGGLYVFGQEITYNFNPLYKVLGLVYQDNILIKNFSVQEQLEFFANLAGFTDSQANEEAKRVAGLLNLSECLEMNTETLSGGQKRKLCIASALIKDPKIMILDEPTSGVDISSRQEIWKTLGMLSDCTVLVTTHALEEAEFICTKLIVMKSAKIAFDGTTSELRKQYHCGYYIVDLDQTCDLDELLKIVKTHAPEAKIYTEHPYTIFLTSETNMADTLAEITQRKDEINLNRFTVHIENLEHTLLKIIMDEEVMDNQK